VADIDDINDNDIHADWLELSSNPGTRSTEEMGNESKCLAKLLCPRREMLINAEGMTMFFWSSLAREKGLDKFGWAVATCGKLGSLRDVLVQENTYLSARVDVDDPDTLEMLPIQQYHKRWRDWINLDRALLSMNNIFAI
jgi:hypothetical protein